MSVLGIIREWPLSTEHVERYKDCGFFSINLLDSTEKVSSATQEVNMGVKANRSWVRTLALLGQAACRKYGRPQPQLA